MRSNKASSIPPFPHLDLERSYSSPVAGIDEAGCGAWAGPIVAAAVCLNPRRPWEEENPGIRDSKQCSPQERERLFKWITTSSDIDFGVGQASVEEIDQQGLGMATRLAMQRAVGELPSPPRMALVDGIRLPVLACPTLPVVKGDCLSLSIAAASILAKVTRDRFMHDLAKHHPFYGWESNVGYGTKRHQKALSDHGVSPFHRRSYAPIKCFLNLL